MSWSCSGELWTQKLKSHLVRTQSLNVLPLKPGVGQCIVYTNRQWFLPCLFLPFQSIHLYFFQNLSWFFPVLAVANTGSCVGPQNKIDGPAGCRFLCWVPAEGKQAHKTWLLVWWLRNDWLGDRVKFVFSPDVILCGWPGSKHQLTNQLTKLWCHGLVVTIILRETGQRKVGKESEDEIDVSAESVWGSVDLWDPLDPTCKKRNKRRDGLLLILEAFGRCGWVDLLCRWY